VTGERYTDFQQVSIDHQLQLIYINTINTGH